MIGRIVRIASAVYNFPEILQNLSRHYEAYEAEIRRLNAVTTELRYEADLAARMAGRAEEQTSALRRQVDALAADLARFRQIEEVPAANADLRSVRLGDRAPSEKPAAPPVQRGSKPRRGGTGG